MNTIKNIAEPFFGIDVTVFASGEEGLYNSDALSGIVGTGKEVVFASDSRRKDAYEVKATK